jgi:hypothetical protein
MFMAMSNLIRWGAIGAMLGGMVTIVAGGILSTPVFSGEDSSWYQQDLIWYIVEFAGKVALLVGLVGFYLYLRRSPRFGWLGTVAFFLLIVVTSYEVILALIALAPGSAAENVDSSLGPLKELGKVLAILLFGITILRAGTLPRAGAWLMLFALLVAVVSIGSIIFGPEAFADWSFPLASVLLGLAYITLGYGLWSHRNEPVPPARPEPVT